MLELPGDGDDSNMMWVCKKDGFGPAKVVDGGRVIEIIIPRLGMFVTIPIDR